MEFANNKSSISIENSFTEPIYIEAANYCPLHPKGNSMSFKNFSASQAAPGNDKPEDKAKTAPAVDAPAAEPARKQDESAPAQKS